MWVGLVRPIQGCNLSLVHSLDILSSALHLNCFRVYYLSFILDHTYEFSERKATQLIQMKK